jgi:hypothetical protein
MRAWEPYASARNLPFLQKGGQHFASFLAKIGEQDPGPAQTKLRCRGMDALSNLAVPHQPRAGARLSEGCGARALR